MKAIKTIQDALKTVSSAETDIQVSFADNPAHGDYTTNLALIFAKKLSRNPKELATEWVDTLKSNSKLMGILSDVSVAGPGFINFSVSQKYLKEEFSIILKDTDRYGLNESLKGEKVFVEYTDPNPFKEFHIGHLYPNLVGETIARLYEANGATVYRASYQGDVGLHVAKAIWGSQQLLSQREITIDDLQKYSVDDQIQFFAEAYSLGSTRYEEGESIQFEIKELNKKIYQKDADIYHLYQLGRSTSLAYFENMYRRLGTKFDYYYFESEVSDLALETVKSFLGTVFEESKNAVIYPGEKYGLHTRVFINNQGLPTYEAKDLALAQRKEQDVPYDTSIIVTANEVDEYFKVVLSALSHVRPDLADKTVHISHGLVKLPEGKISSRSGKVITAEWLLDEAAKFSAGLSDSMKNNPTACEQVGLAAVRFALLKNTLGGDVEFTFSSSLSFTGNSGPSLQYSYVRALSIINKSSSTDTSEADDLYVLSTEEAEVLRYLSRFPEIIITGQKKYSSNILCTYLYELAQKYNAFYNLHQIIGSDQEAFRVQMSKAVSIVLKNGLTILGIPTPNKL